MTAGVGRVRNLAFLSILMLLKPLLHLSYFTGGLCVNRFFRSLLKVSWWKNRLYVHSSMNNHQLCKSSCAYLFRQSSHDLVDSGIPDG